MEAGEVRARFGVLGGGYVGLVTSACLARLGFHVCCVDRNEARVEGLRRDEMPFFEAGLAQAVPEGIASGRLNFAQSISAVHGADAIFVCVGTLDEAGEWSAAEVESAVLTIAADAEAPRVVIIRSTLAPGTTTRLVELAQAADPRVELALNPEFSRQGTALADFMQPDRIVLGLTVEADASRALPILRRAYAAIDAPLVVTDAASAELIKIGSNVYLALKAGFANEIGRLSAATGADAAQVVDGIGLDARIGRAYLTPGPGLGGSCLPAQARALPAAARELDVYAPIIGAVDSSNAAQADWVVKTLERSVGDLALKRITILGLTFKAGTDDVRESAALRVARALAAKGAVLCAHDPMGERAAAALLEREGIGLETCPSAQEAIGGCDAVVVTTEWPEYAAIDWEAAAATMRGRSVLDTRYVVDEARATAAGLKVTLLGR